MFNHKATPIGVTCIYDKKDVRLTNKVDIHVQYIGTGLRKNKVLHKTVSVTEAEKAVIESIAMRLFLEHRKVVKRIDSPDGKVRMQGVIAVDLTK